MECQDFCVPFLSADVPVLFFCHQPKQSQKQFKFPTFLNKVSCETSASCLGTKSTYPHSLLHTPEL